MNPVACPHPAKNLVEHRAYVLSGRHEAAQLRQHCQQASLLQQRGLPSHVRPRHDQGLLLLLQTEIVGDSGLEYLAETGVYCGFDEQSLLSKNREAAHSHVAAGSGQR